MNIQEKIEVLEKQSQELEKQLQELKKEVNKSKGQFPKVGDRCYWINGFGDVEIDTWNGSPGDYRFLEIGNVFKTKAEAKFMVERLKVIKELKKFSREFEYGKPNYFILFDYDEEDLVLEWATDFKSSTLFFDSSEMVEKAIETVGKERIKKYYFGIGEE